MCRPIVLMLALFAGVSSAEAQFVADAFGSAAPAVPVEDTLPPAISTITITETFTVADLQVSVAVDHTWVGDLVVTLVSPTGIEVPLHDSQGSAGALAVTWWEYGPPNSAPYDCACIMQPAPGSLLDLAGETSAGDWTLIVEDVLPLDSGVFTDWSLALSASGPPPAIESLVCQPTSGGGAITVTWTSPVPYDTVSLYVDGMFEASVPGFFSSYSFGPFSEGTTVEICAVGTVAGIDAPPTCCVLFVPLASNGTAVVFAGEQPSVVDSAGALSNALIALGKNVQLITGNLSPAFIGTPESLWLCLGTFPDHYVMTEEEGAYLRDLLLAGVPIYVESADLWGFLPPTPFSDVDGVANEGVVDGDDSLFGLVGGWHADLDLSDLASPYTQDQAGNDFTDRLIAASNDLLGPNAGVVWSDDLTGGSLGYDVTVYYVTDTTAGNVVCSAWEFGGYNGDPIDLASRYVKALAGFEAPGDLFRRGDANIDGSFDIGDAVATLGFLFTAALPVPPCSDAMDSNDDGTIDVADAIFSLSALFFASSPQPPAPGPYVCGHDPTDDGLDCAETPFCN
ncbi:MAG: proprotein convertase P-domain-containing protein [Planctomycetota bacterium]